ncbi:MAG: hypothetical protein JW878_08515 [Methanomicrobia archaeon]|nr:hypothetical protein [Methanomicrobia archaeon]
MAVKGEKAIISVACAVIMLVSSFALALPIGTTESVLAASISPGSAAVGHDFDINGTAYTPDVGIVIVSPNGENGDKIDGSGKGVYYTSVSFSGVAFSKKITVGSDIDTGSYLVAVLSPGRDGYYELGNGADVDSFFEAFEEQYVITGKSQAQVLELLKDAISVPGSDDLMQVGYVAVTTVPVTGEEETIPLYLPYESSLFSYPSSGSYVIGRSWNNNLSDDPDMNCVIVRLSSTEEIICNGGYFLKHDRKTRADSWSEVDGFVPINAPIYNYTAIITGSRVREEGTITITTTKVSDRQEPVVPNETKLIFPFFLSYSLQDASKNTISYTEDEVTFVGTNVEFENDKLHSEYTLDKNNLSAWYVDENGITQRTTNVEVEVSNDIRSAKIVVAPNVAPTDVPTATPTAEEEGEGLPETPSSTADTTPVVTEPTSSPTIAPAEGEEEKGTEYPVPGFEAVFAIAGLAAAGAYLLRKK